MEETYSQFKSHNESKNIFKAARTPAVFFAIAVIFYILSGVFGLFGIYSIANTCNLLMGVALLTLVTWFYVRYVSRFFCFVFLISCRLFFSSIFITTFDLTYRYSGEMVEFGSQLDELANFLWENVSYKNFIFEYTPLCLTFQSLSYPLSGNKTLTFPRILKIFNPLLTHPLLFLNPDCLFLMNPAALNLRHVYQYCVFQVSTSVLGFTLTNFISFFPR